MSAVSSKIADVVRDRGVSAHSENVPRLIPSELDAFCRRSGPQSLLIRGPPGAGKTSLALALLESFSGTRIMVSTRVVDHQLERDFPWLRHEDAVPIQIVNAQTTPHALARAAEAIDSLTRVVEEDSTEDMKSFLWLPGPVQEAYASIDPSQPAMVVIDSWDALVEAFIASGAPGRPNIPNREDIERLLLSYLSRSEVTLVLIVERAGSSQLDYLVNAVVTVQSDLSGGRLERTLAIIKLRGLRVETPTYPFTLEGARFRSIGRFRRGSDSDDHSAGPYLPAEPTPQGWGFKVWPGSSDFDAAFGSLLPGATTLIEMDPEVPLEVVHVIIDPPVAATLAQGGRVLLTPAPGTTAATAYRYYRRLVPASVLEAQLRMVWTHDPEKLPSDIKRILIQVDASTAPEKPVHRQIVREALDFIDAAGSGSSAVPNLRVGSSTGDHHVASALGSVLVPENYPDIASGYVANQQSHQIIVGWTGDLLFHSLSDAAALHLQFRARNGRYFINGLRPYTPYYVISEGDATHPYRLTRMV